MIWLSSVVQSNMVVLAQGGGKRDIKQRSSKYHETRYGDKTRSLCLMIHVDLLKNQLW